MPGTRRCEIIAFRFSDKISIKNALAYADSSTNLEWKINFGGEHNKQDTQQNLRSVDGLDDLTLPSEEA